MNYSETDVFLACINIGLTNDIADKLVMQLRHDDKTILYNHIIKFRHRKIDTRVIKCNWKQHFIINTTLLTFNGFGAEYDSIPPFNISFSFFVTKHIRFALPVGDIINLNPTVSDIEDEVNYYTSNHKLDVPKFHFIFPSQIVVPFALSNIALCQYNKFYHNQAQTV